MAAAVSLLSCTHAGAPPTASSTTFVNGSTPAGPLTGAYVCSRPEANLHYPNANEFLHTSSDETLTAAAECDTTFTSDDDQQVIYNYFTDWALGHGYKYYGGVRADADASNRMFKLPSCREGITFAVQSPASLRDSGINVPLTASTKTVFLVSVLILPNNDACPTGDSIPPVPSTPAPRVS